MASSNADLSKSICRVCLQNISERGMASIFDLDTDLDEIFIYEKIEQCAGIEVLRNENFPTFICSSCHRLLKDAYAFRITCRKTNEFLKTTFVAEKTNNPTKQFTEQNPLSIKDDTKGKKKSHSPVKENTKNRKSPRSKMAKSFKIDSNSIPESNKNELIISPAFDDVKNATTTNENTKVSSPLPDFIKNEITNMPDSPTNFEEPIPDNFNDDDANVLRFDVGYNDDYENDDPSDENTEAPNVKIMLDISKRQISRIKTKKKKRNANGKSRKSTRARSKVLTPSKNDNGDELNNEPPRIKREKKEKHPHICEICGNTFPHRYTLKNHIKRHFNEKPFKCEVCSYSSHSNMELVRHLRKHTGSKPFKCQYCTRAFGDHSTLIKHERVHRNERPFKCEICGNSFSYPAVLKRHKLVHTGEKPYKCEICGKCFNDRYHLQSHLKTLRHQNDPRIESLLQNIRENNIQ